MEQQNRQSVVVAAEPPVLRRSARTVLLLPLAFTAGLAGLAVLPSVRDNSRLLTAFLMAAAVLLTWNAFLFFWTLRTGRVLTVNFVVKKQHAVQACAQAAVLLYWGWYWREVYASAYLILAQLLFAYAFDLLLGWSRRDECTLGFAQFPIVFSINLFLWFKPDWFYLQFLMVAVGLTAKELIRWNKDGRKVHIFNPSSFPLALFSLLLLAKGASDITWGHQISITQFYPPHMYLFLFLIALPGQLFFGVTSMTMSAVVTTYLFGLLYQAVTGVYFFYDSYIPIAVFLGMHLLFNDPSTSPRTELGRIIYGALYGLSTVLLYRLLGSFGMPTFYDKLLQVPLLNLSVQWIDRLARSRWLRAFDPAAWAKLLPSLRRKLAYLSIWTVVFAGMSAAQGVGDNHPGQWLPFWRNACQEGRAYACPYLADVELGFCQPRFGLGVQRCRTHGYCAGAVGRGSSPGRSRASRGALYTRMPGRIPDGLRESHHAHQGRAALRVRAANTQGLSDHLERLERRNSRSQTFYFVRPRVPRGLEERVCD